MSTTNTNIDSAPLVHQLASLVGAEQEDNQSVIQVYEQQPCLDGLSEGEGEAPLHSLPCQSLAPTDSCEGNSISSSVVPQDGTCQVAVEGVHPAVIGGPPTELLCGRQLSAVTQMVGMEMRDENPNLGEKPSSSEPEVSIDSSAKEELHISIDPGLHHSQSQVSVPIKDESESVLADVPVSNHDVEQKGATEGVKTEHVAVINESLPEQVQVVGERKLVLNDNHEIFEMNTGIMDTSSLDQKATYLADKHFLETEAFGCSSEALQNGDLRHKEETAVEEKEQGMAIHSADTKNMEQSPVSNTLNETTCIAADSNSAVDVVSGSQAADRGDFQTDEVETFSVQPTVPLGNITPDSEFTVAKDYVSTSQEGQNVETHMLEISTTEERNQANDVGSEKELVVRFPELAESDVITSHASGLHEESTNTNRDDSKRTQTTSNANVVAGYDQVKGTEKQVIDLNALEPEISSRSGHVFSYSSVPEEEGKFSTSDLVWGKVKSHPWWPGQIFDSSDASERAMKYKRNNKFLVAYFGDQTFAWNGASSLHHFRTHFSKMEKQSNSDAFRTAVDYALDEVCRRVELRMACACTPKEVYEKFNSRVIENAGIREEARRVYGPDTSLRVPSFESAKLLRYLKASALNINDGGNKLELKIAQGQLLSFFRLKGYCRLPEFHVYGGLLEDTSSQLGEEMPSLEVIEHGNPGCQISNQTPSDKEKVRTRDGSSHKGRHVSDGSLHSSKKAKSLLKMSGKKAPSHDVNPKKTGFNKKSSSNSATSSDIKRKAIDSLSKDTTIKSTKRKTLVSREVDTKSSTPQSFKVGECFRRIASQLTGSPPILKCSGEKFQRSSSRLDRDNENNEGDGSRNIPEESHGRLVPKEYSSSGEMLTQLHLAAQDPMNGYSFLDIRFFSEFRNSICLEYSTSGKRKRYVKTGCGKPVLGNRKSNNTETSSSKTFDFEELKDSFWIDRIIQSSPEEEPSCKTMERKGESQFGTSTGLNDSPFQAENPFQSRLVLGSEERNIDDDYDPVKEKPSRRYHKRKKKTQVVLPMDDSTGMDSEFPSPSGHEVVKGKSLSRSNENMYVNELSPTELSMSFTDSDSIPSELNLNKIFRRFGPLKESETEVMKDAYSARVVFKKRTDAEVAFNSAAKFSIFGPVHVNYQLRFKGKFE